MTKLANITDYVYNYWEGMVQLIAPAEYPSAPLINTKLSAPQLRSGLVDRPTLLGKLRESASHSLTLICAPAGYGKTTLLVNWIAELKKTPEPDNPIICWLSLDEGDNEPIRFISYLVAAIETAGTGISAEVQTIFQSGTHPPLQTILAVLINNLEKSTHVIYLILDDYQFISNDAIHDGIAFLLEHLPSNVQLVIATRFSTAHSIGPLSPARRQMTEIRANDLRFSYTEADCRI